MQSEKIKLTETSDVSISKSNDLNVIIDDNKSIANSDTFSLIDDN